MYKSFFFFAALAAGCGLEPGAQSEVTGVDEQALQHRPSDECLPPRVLLCHHSASEPWTKPLCLQADAVDAHAAHGDAPGDCPQVGTPKPPDEGSAQALPWTPQVPTPPAQIAAPQEPPADWTPQVPKEPAQVVSPDAPPLDWTPVVPKPPAQICAVESAACAADADCCDGLECAWGVCLMRLP